MAGATYKLAPTNMAKRFPQHAYPYANNIWMDPGALKVQEFIVNVTEDIINRYAVDGLTVYFITSDYELYTFNLCCSRCNGVDKAGEAVSQPIQQQLNLFGLLPYMDNYKITFTSDRGSNILKALKDSSSSGDDTTTPSSSKYVAANTLLSDLLSKSEEVLNTITTSKKLFKYAGLNKNIEEHGDIALKQECVVRWLSMSNILQLIDASIEHIRSILSSKSSKNQCYFKLSDINIIIERNKIDILLYVILSVLRTGFFSKTYDSIIKIATYDINSTPIITFKNDELKRYLRVIIDDISKQPNLLPFWRDLQK
ncbi:unnamed protein product [Rotaria sordida]|uniref:Uncharacterized protein n=1 Tax=Rotaria sordida TaxID=392033 RepID=A0A813X253_9BILA|nr:unnamed protein product [Rotaria sordida]CAF1532138.1 unnamed protein product [Rotaria sordida]